MGTRRALIFATGGRYLTLVLQIVGSFFVAHHVLPDQFGLTVLGSGALLVATALRDLGTSGYLVQLKDLDQHRVRSAFTISLIATLVITGVLVAAARPIATFYGDGRLAGYLHLMACAYALGPFINPTTALLSRDLRFRAIATIDVGSGIVGLAFTIVLVRLGFGFTSVAWAAIARALAALILSLAVKRDLWLFKPSLREWRTVLNFGFHGTAMALVYTLSEALIYLMLGKLVDVRSVGLIQRAYLLTQVPERVVLAGVGAVAMPAFAKLARSGAPLVPPYIHSIRLVAPVYLAAMLALVVLARPLVLALLGPGWVEVVTLTRIMAIAHLIGLGLILNMSVLIAVGGIERAAWLALSQMVVVLAATAIAAQFGLVAVACSAFVTLPINTLTSYLALRKWVSFSWQDVSAAGTAGALAATCGVAPAAALVAIGWQEQHPFVVLLASAMLGAASWTAALRLLHHPLFAEITGTMARVRSGSRREPGRS